MGELIDIREYVSDFCEIEILGLRRKAPLYCVKNNMWVVGNEHLSFGCDVELTERVARALAKRLRKFNPQCLLTAEAKSLAIVYEVAKNLGHDRYALARKSLKQYTRGYLRTEIKSITTGKLQPLVIDDLNVELIMNKDIVLIDDVISTGQTMDGLRNLAEQARANTVALCSVWMEGPWPFEKYAAEFHSGMLVYLDTLPIFALGEEYKSLIEYKQRVERDLNLIDSTTQGMALKKGAM